jgi:hypothetical protein
MNPPDPTGPDGKQGGDLPPYQRQEPTPNEVQAALIAQYHSNEDEWMAAVTKRAAQDLRRRRDGTPSAVPPHPTVPLVLWAVYEATPDGGDYDDQYDALEAYQGWLRRWRARGLYDGGTDLIFVNRKDLGDPDDPEE